MKNPRVVLFPLLVLLAAGLLWFFQGGGGDIDRIDPTDTLEVEETDGKDLEIESTKTDEDVVARVVAEPGDEEEPARREHESYLAALGGLTGRLVWEKSEEPLAGVEVAAIEARADLVVPTVEQVFELVGSPNPLRFGPRARTDKDGRFTLRGVHARAIHLLGIGLKTETAAVRFVARAPQPGETVDLGDIEILRRGTLTGVVQDRNGKPIGGVRVRGLDIPQVAFQFGIGDFRSDGLVMATLPGGASGAAMVLPMPKWLPEVDRLLPFAETTTRSDGSFTLEGVRAGQVTVLAQKDGEVPVFRATRVRAEKERKVGTLRFARGSAVTLRFVDTAGKPVTTARVAGGRMFTMAPFGLTAKPQQVDDKGVGVVKGLPRGKVYVVWQRRPGATWQSVGPLRDGDTRTIKLPAIREAIVRVVDQKGKAVEAKGLQVKVSRSFRGVLDMMPIPGLLPTIRDPDVRPVDGEPGVFRVRGVSAGQYRVIARAEGYAVGAAELDIKKDKPEAEVAVKLVRGVTSDFLVVDAKRKPVAGAHVYWNARRGTPASFKGARAKARIPVVLGQTDEEGKLRVDTVPLGATRFVARHPAHSVVSVSNVKTQIGKPLVIQLAPLGALEITVTERGSRPKEPATLLLEPRVSGDGDAFVPPRFVMTDANGRAVLTNLQPCKWNVQKAPPLDKLKSIDDIMKISMMFRGRQTSADVEVKSGAVAKVSLELDRSTERLKFTGVVQLAVQVNGKALRGAQVRMWGQENDSKPLDGNGRVIFTNLRDGRY